MMAGVEYDFSVMYPETNFSNENVPGAKKLNKYQFGLLYFTKQFLNRCA